MSENKVQIVVEVDSATGEVRIRQLGESMADAGRQGERGFRQASAGADQLERAMLPALGLAKALGFAFGAWELANMARDSALAAARFETLGVAMGVVGNNAGYTRAEMDGFAAALQRGGIAMTESRESLTRMAQAQIELSNATSLARIAQDAAVVAGINSSEAFERLVHGVQSAQVEVLRTIGLNVNFENSYKKLADQLGKTTSELSEAEKVQARVNVVMAAGAGIAGTYEAAMGTAGKQLGSTRRHLDDLGVRAGAVFNDILIIGVQGFTAGLKEANGEAAALAANGTLEIWGKGLAYTFAILADTVAMPFKVLATATEGLIAFGFAFAKTFEMIENATSGHLKKAKRNWEELKEIDAQFTQSTKARWANAGGDFTAAAREMFAGRTANAAGDAAAQAEQERKRIAAAAAAREQAKAAADAAAADAKRQADAERAAKEAERLAEQWARTRAELERDLRLDGLEGLDLALARISERAEELRAMPLADQKLIDQWQVLATSAAIRADEEKRLAEERRKLAAITAEYNALTLEALPEEARGVEEVRRRYAELREQLVEVAMARNMDLEEYDRLQAALNAREGEAQRALQDRLNKGTDRHRRAASEVETIWARAWGNIQDLTADWLYHLEISFDSLKDLFRRTVAQLVSAWAWGQAKMAWTARAGTAAAAGAGVAGAPGNAMAAGGGISDGLGFLGNLSKMGSNALFNAQVGATEFAYNTLGWNAGGNFISGLSPAAFGGITAGLGTLLMTGDVKQAIGSSAGAYLGTMLLPGIGTVLGSIAGSMLGGLFGGKEPSNRSAGGAVDLATGGIHGQWNMTGGKQSPAETLALRDSILGLVAGVSNEIRQLGGRLAGSFSLDVGVRDGIQANLGRGMESFGNDAEKALAEIGKRLFAGADWSGLLNRESFGRLTGEARAALRRQVKGGLDLEGVQGLLRYFGEIESMMAGVDESLKLRGMSEYQRQLYQINQQFDALAGQFRAAGIDLARYTNLEKLRRATLQDAIEAEKERLRAEKERAAEAARRDAERLLGPARQLIEDYERWFNGMRFSSGAPGQSYEAIEGRYTALLAGSRAGDLDSTRRLMEFVERDYLPFMQAYAPNYQEVFDRLFGAGGQLSGLTVRIDPQDQVSPKMIKAAVVEAVREGLGSGLPHMRIQLAVDGKVFATVIANALDNKDPRLTTAVLKVK